jgi:hypothetical protein
MTYADLLDQIAYDAGDTSGEYRLRATHWLNLARGDIADRGKWRSAVDPTASITTSAATTSGIYTIGDYDYISGDFLYDETNNQPVQYESFSQVNVIDVQKTTTSSPDTWSDAGADSNGNRQIYLWPIPAGTYTIRFTGYRKLTDIVETDSIDPFFGAITPWGPTFSAGIRYYHYQNNNEDASQIALQFKIFERFIKQRKRNNQLSPGATLRLGIVRTQAPIVTGRFDPAHYSNRG